MFNNKFTQKDEVADLIKSIVEADYTKKMEELKGDQHKLDKNKNGKLDAQDFKMLRKEEEEVNENASSGEEEKFHQKLDKLVHKTFGKSEKEKVQEAAAKVDIPAYKRKEKGGEWTSNLKDLQDRPDTIQGQAKRDAEKKRAEYRKEDAGIDEDHIDEGWDDMIKASKKAADDQKSKKVTRTGHEVKKTSTGTVYTKTYDKKTGLSEEELDERELTPGEALEKERLVKGMKKSLAGFKARYGDRAKSVMYATATKQAKED